MRKVIKIFSVIFVLAVGVVVAGVAILSTMDFNQYKGLIADEAKKFTGRDLLIAGDLKLEISLNPALAVEGVTFANAPWGSRPEMIKLNRLAAEVNLLPLLSGTLVVDRLVLEGLDLLAETDAKGRGNWEFQATTKEKAAAAPSDDSGAGILPVVKKVRIRDVKITYRDGKKDETTKLTLDSMDLGADSADSPLDIAVSGNLNGVPYKASGQLGAIAALLKGGGSYPISLKAEALAAVVGVNGSVNDPLNKPGLNITISAEGGELTNTVSAVGVIVPDIKTIALPNIGPYNVSALIMGTPDKLSVSNIKVSVGKADQVLITASGKVGNPLKAKGIALDFAVEGKDISGFEKTVGGALPKPPPFRVSGKVYDSGGGYAVSGINIKIGDSDISGGLAANLSGARPSVNANFTSTLLDLDKLFPKGAAQAQVPPPPSSDGRVFPAEPLPLEGLKAADAKVNFKGKRIIMQGVNIDNVSVALSLVNGNLKVSPFALGITGGKVNGAVSLNASSPSPPLSIKVNVKQVDYGELLSQLGQSDIATGKIDMDINLKGSGKSVRAIMAGLNGKLRIVTQGGKIRSGLLNIVSADALSALPFISSKGDKDIRCAVIDFRMSAGNANAKTFLLDTGGLTMIGKGRINLANEALNLHFDPHAKKASLLKLALPVNVTGTMASPTVLPDVTGATIGAVTGAVSTVTDLASSGISTIGSLVSGGGLTSSSAKQVDATDYCKLALVGRPLVAKKSTAPASTKKKEPSFVEKTTESVGSAVKGIGAAIGGILSRGK